MANKRLIMAVVVVLLVSVCLFAENGSVSFKMFHAVNPMDEHGFLFYDPTKDSEITSADLTKGTATSEIQFARLMVIFNVNTTTGIQLQFTALVSTSANADGSYNCLPYEVWCFSRSADKMLGSTLQATSLSTVEANKDDTVGSIDVYSSLVLKPKINGALELREIAMMYITLDMENAAADTYAGTIKAVFTSN